ncbi:MAG TPA: hypothetical protein VGO60_13445, partial [Iamia sp.]|nr:hypothetical protein [Iamia sp.]
PPPPAASGPPPAPPPPGPASGTDPARRRGRAALAGAALIVVLLLAAAAGYALTRDDGGDDDAVATDTTESTTTAPPATASSTTEEETASTTTTTTEAETTTSTTTTTTTQPVDTEVTAEDLEAAATTYYDGIASGDLEGSYALLSPRFQGEQDFESYRRFWTETVESVEVQGRPHADAEAMTTDLTLRYHLTDGSDSVEDVRLTFVPGQDRALLIDEYDVTASRDRPRGDQDQGED